MKQSEVINQFKQSIYEEVCKTLEQDEPNWDKIAINITVGDHTIVIPMTADNQDTLEVSLDKFIELAEDDNE